jgi:hypothetical protein
MKSRTSALAVITAVFLIGCLLGIAGYHFYERSLQKQTSYASGIQGHTGRLADRLQLNNAQKAQLDVILEDSRGEIDAGRMEVETKMQAIRAKANEKIAAILSDEQKKKFQQFLSESESHRGLEGRSHGRGGHRWGYKWTRNNTDKDPHFSTLIHVTNVRFRRPGRAGVSPARFHALQPLFANNYAAAATLRLIRKSTASVSVSRRDAGAPRAAAFLSLVWLLLRLRRFYRSLPSISVKTLF